MPTVWYQGNSYTFPDGTPEDVMRSSILKQGSNPFAAAKASGSVSSTQPQEDPNDPSLGELAKASLRGISRIAGYDPDQSLASNALESTKRGAAMMLGGPAGPQIYDMAKTAMGGGNVFAEQAKALSPIPIDALQKVIEPAAAYARGEAPSKQNYLNAIEGASQAVPLAAVLAAGSRSPEVASEAAAEAPKKSSLPMPPTEDEIALANQAGEAQAKAVPRTKNWQQQVRDSLQSDIDTRAQNHTEAASITSSTTPELESTILSGRAAYVDPEGTIVHLDPAEIGRLDDAKEPVLTPVKQQSGGGLSNGPTAGGVPEEGAVPLPQSELRQGNGQAGGQNSLSGPAQATQGVEKPLRSDADFDAWLDSITDDAPGTKTVARPASPEEEAQLGGAPMTRPLEQSAPQEQLIDVRGGPLGKKGPPSGSEPPPTDRGPGELPEEPQAKQTGFLRSVYDRTFPQIADAIERMGHFGEDTALKMREATRQWAQWTAPTRADVSTATKGFNAQQWDTVGGMLEDWSKKGLDDPNARVAAANGNQAVADAAALIRQESLKRADVAKEVIPGWQPIDDYLKHFGEPGEVNSVGNLVRTAGNEEGSLTRSRQPGSQRPTGMDVRRAVMTYFNGADRYLAELKAFGVTDRAGLQSAIDDLAQKVQDSGYDGDFVKRYASKALSGGIVDDSTANKLSSLASYPQVILKPVFAAIRHIPAFANDLASMGVGNTVRGIGDALTQKFGLSPEGARAVLESGALMRNAAEDMVQSGGLGTTALDKTVSGLRAASNVANTPVRLLDAAKARVTANAAAHWYDELTAMARGESVPLAQRLQGDLRPTAAIQAEAVAKLKRAGVDVENLSDPEAYRQGRLNFMWQTVQDLQKSTGRIGSQAFSLTPWGRVLYTFQKLPMWNVDFVANHILKPVAQGNLAPLSRYAFAVGALGLASNEAIRAIKGRDSVVKKIATGDAGEEDKTQAIEDMIPHGFVGRPYSFNARPVQHGDWRDFVPQPENFADYALGHTGAVGANLGDAVHVLKAIHTDNDRSRLAHILRLSGQARIAHDAYNAITGNE